MKNYGNGDYLINLFSTPEVEGDNEGRLLKMEPVLYAEDDFNSVVCWLELKIGYDRLYVVRNIRDLVHASHVGNVIEYGKGLQLNASTMEFEPGLSQGLWNMVRAAVEEEDTLMHYSTRFHYDYSYNGSYIFSGKRFRLSLTNARRFIELVGNDGFTVQYGYSKFECFATKELPRINLAVNPSDADSLITLKNRKSLLPLLDGCELILDQNSGLVHCLEDADAKRYKSIRDAFFLHDTLKLPNSAMGRFFSETLPELEKLAEVDVAPDYQERFCVLPLEAEVRLDYYGDGIEAGLRFSYGDMSFNPILSDSPVQSKLDKRVLVQDRLSELKVKHIFERYGFVQHLGHFVQPEESLAYDFLADGIEQLTQLSYVDIYYAEVFGGRPVTKFKGATVGVRVSSNLLKLDFNCNRYDFAELVEILGSYRQKRRYHRLQDGRFLSLEEQQIAGLDELLLDADLQQVQRDGNTLEMPMSRALYVDALGREADGIRLERDSYFKKLTRSISSPDTIDAEAPKSLQGILRDYQLTGFAWLEALSRYGLGGILADDMGLGKTLQTIAFVLYKKEHGDLQEPVLIVAPTSLIYNWLDELKRFAPQLQAIVVAGTAAERNEKLEEAFNGVTDMVITTYHMLRRDIGGYEKRHFSFCFLDEAQHIKNPTTKLAKAVKQVRAGGYFALTGTPIENNLTELWSVFDFLMPGFLYAHKKFRQQYELPIVRAEDKRVRARLSRNIAPFVLRRMKKDVLRELPDKVESRMMNEMTLDQSKVYMAYFARAQKDLRKELAAHGFKESQIKILALLTRLRQIACDPSLFLENYDGGSGKLDQLEEILTDAVEAGHRVLLFSQFTGMLGNIAKRLNGLDMKYMYLDGSTPAKERLRLVNAFNNGQIPVFLISLKAGGMGLNLTGADMVIHYDPWWNPAVEDQATDRAYRIGQQNNVQVLRLITKDTIEEKIFALQERKRALIDQLIKPGQTFLSNLSEAEIMDLFK